MSALGRPGLVGDVDARGDVALEQLGGRLRVELVVDVLAARLVLDERDRVRELADVVVVRRDAGEQRIGADRLGRASPRGCRPSGSGGTCPGVSTRSRRSRGCDGFASSSSWNTVTIPNSEPRTANEPDRRHRRAARGDRRRADQLDDAPDVLVAEQREHQRRRAPGRRTRRCPPGRTPPAGRRAARRRCPRSRPAARRPRAPGPATVDRGARGARAARVRTIATPASSSTVTSIRTAASGSAYGRMSRPAVSLSANTANSSSRLSSSRTLLRCQNSRRNRQVQVSSSADHEHRQHDEPDQPGDVEAALVEAEALDRPPRRPRRPGRRCARSSRRAPSSW